MLAEREVLDGDDAGFQSFELAYEDVASGLDQVPQFLGTADIEDVGVGVDAQRRQEYRLDVVGKFDPPG